MPLKIQIKIEKDPLPDKSLVTQYLETKNEGLLEGKII